MSTIKTKLDREEAIEVLRLWYMTELTLKEIASKMKCSRGAAHRVAVSEEVYHSLPRPETLPAHRY